MKAGLIGLSLAALTVAMPFVSRRLEQRLPSADEDFDQNILTLYESI